MRLLRRALLLTYYWPPRPAIASVRAEHLVASLSAHGWEVVPVVPDFGDVCYDRSVCTTGVVEFKAPVRRFLGVREGETAHAHFHVDERGVLERPSWKQQALETGHRVLSFADGRLGWLGPGVRAVREILRKERVDAIISTSPPVATHLVAAGARGDVPWIADLRDPWLRSDDLSGGPVFRAIDELLEGYAFRAAGALVTVSEPIAQSLRNRYPHKRVYAIANAFWKREWDGIPFVHPPKATFLHAGSLYRGARNPRPFFEALAQLRREGEISEREVSVEFYGERENWLECEIERYGLGGIVALCGRRPRAEILARERAASRLVVIAADGAEERGTYTGKLFEYLGARRPIIAVGGPAERTVMDEALTLSGAGERHRDAGGLQVAIIRALEEWRRGETATLTEEAVAPFELTQFGARYARVVEEVSNAASASR
ncbi:MAG: glycosyltransferase [Candidatus Aquilonibacter sp.]